MLGLGLGTYIKSSPFTNSSFVGLLDTYSGAAAAYSVRLLSSTYAGSAIRVRRSSDNTEQNIGFDSSGNLDTASLLSFCGAGNGFVTTWYDQSGNGNNATQTTATNQPQIVSSGSVILENGKPSIFSSSTNYFAINSITYPNTFSHFAVARNNGDGLQKRITGDRLNAPRIPTFRYISLNKVQTTNNVSILITTADNTAPVALNIISAISNLTNSIISINNVSTINTNTAGDTLNMSQLFATGGTLIVEPLNSNCSEFITYNTNQASNNSAIVTNINTYYGIY